MHYALKSVPKGPNIGRLGSLICTLALAALAGTGLCRAADDNARKLRYKQPAGAWTEALPVGNGRLAAMVFGDTLKERLQLNEDTVWSGEKRDRSNPEASKSFPEVRRLLLDGHPAQAQALADRTMISVPRALPVYQTLGDLWLDFGAVTQHDIAEIRGSRFAPGAPSDQEASMARGEFWPGIIEYSFAGEDDCRIVVFCRGRHLSGRAPAVT